MPFTACESFSSFPTFANLGVAWSAPGLAESSVAVGASYEALCGVVPPGVDFLLLKKRMRGASKYTLCSLGEGEEMDVMEW